MLSGKFLINLIVHFTLAYHFMNTPDASYWIKQLDLQPHPEGGYYKEVYRSANKVSREQSRDLKDACTSIYYLLQGADYSGFHRIGSDELWYFHKGEPLHIHVIDENGTYLLHELSDAKTGSFSIAVKAGRWFAAEVPSKTGFALVSCPGI
jgi:predicted cupin superfamily sugar epimerase